MYHNKLKAFLTEKFKLSSNSIIHFIGISGIGVSALAKIIHELGFTVQGSDLEPNYITDKLKALGIHIYFNHEADNIKNTDLVIKSTAIKDTNVELIAAKQLGIKVISRAEGLAALMEKHFSISIAGTHGKTTTTAITSSLIEAAGLSPTTVNGGVINGKNSNSWLGEENLNIDNEYSNYKDKIKERIIIAEADESDGSFLLLPTNIGIITNVDVEHLDHYNTFDNLKQAFVKFIESVPEDGAIIMNIDDLTVRNIINEIAEKKIKVRSSIITYSIEDIDLTKFDTIISLHCNANNIRITKEGICFDLCVYDQKTKEVLIKDFLIKTYAIHNVSNSLSAIAASLFIGIDWEKIKRGLVNFQGVKRRFTETGKVNDITIIDDYAHHPREISATIATAKNFLSTNNYNNNIIVVLQPHRYSRLSMLMEDFLDCLKDVNVIMICDVFAAGEQKIDGIDAERLVDNLKTKYPNNKIIKYLPQPEINLANSVAELAKTGDIVLCLGAGNITNWAKKLPSQLSSIINNKNSDSK